MKTSKFALVGLLPVLLVLSGCTLPFSSAPQPSIEEQAATLVAQTLFAPAPSQPQQTLPLPQATRPASSPISPTANTSGTPAGTITPTYSVPMLEVDEPTNCRSGPGQNYQIITTFQPGASAEIVGRYPENNWWLINNPFGTGTCWIWGEFATTSGSTWTVPSVTPPPPATEGLPPPPSIANWDFSCSYSGSGPNATFNLRWSDRATNETGYRIYRNDELVTELPPDSSSFTEVADIEVNEEVTYRLEVYNSTGASSASLIRFTCQ